MKLLICSYCGKILSASFIEHKNIEQIVTTHKFCSEGCKEHWCFTLQKHKTRVLVFWAIAEYNSKMFFYKRLVKVSSPSFVGKEGNKTYFTKDLTKVESLELKQINGKPILIVKKHN